jgi:hypothetical protein
MQTSNVQIGGWTIFFRLAGYQACETHSLAVCPKGVISGGFH